MFEIGIPGSWHVEKVLEDSSSRIIASDTAMSIEKTLVIQLNWSIGEVFLNDHFRRSMDSLNELAGFRAAQQRFFTLDEFDVYAYEATGYDSLNSLDVMVINYHLKNEIRDGSLNFFARVNNRDFELNEKVLIEGMLETIRLK